MALDVLVVGGFVFDQFAVPERLPAGGEQRMTVQRLPGGDRVIDAWGPDDADRSWSGTFWGNNALSDALTLDAMRASGAEFGYSSGVESRLVVIKSFTFEVRKFTCVEYRISLTTSDRSGGGGIGGLVGLGLSAIDAAVGADLSAAVGLLP